LNSRAAAPVKNPHQEARCLDCFGRFRHIVVVDFAMSGRVSQYGVGAGEQGAGAFLLAFHHAGTGQWTGRSEGLVHQVDADCFAAEPAKLTNTDLDCSHRCEDSQLVLTNEELGPYLTLNLLVDAGPQPLVCVEGLRALGDPSVLRR
jgi:hypothetical protein